MSIKLTLSVLGLVLNDFFEKRAALLKDTASGRVYVKKLRRLYDDFLVLPPALKDERPMGEQLADTDDTHDAWGSAIWFLFQALIACPLLTVAQRAEVEALQAACMPARKVLTASYAEEAATAQARRQQLPALKAALSQYPAPVSGTLFDWVDQFTTHGEALGTLLAVRADASLSDRSRAVTLRGEILNALHRLRASLSDEIKEDDTLPRDLEARVFAFFDLHA